jgi:hypothetical protein
VITAVRIPTAVGMLANSSFSQQELRLYHGTSIHLFIEVTTAKRADGERRWIYGLIRAVERRSENNIDSR